MDSNVNEEFEMVQLDIEGEGISKPGEMSNAFSYTLLGGANLAASFEFAVKQSRVDRGATFVVQINDERINIREGTTNRRFYHTEAKKFCHKMADGNLIEVTLPVLYGSKYDGDVKTPASAILILKFDTTKEFVIFINDLTKHGYTDTSFNPITHEDITVL